MFSGRLWLRLTRLPFLQGHAVAFQRILVNIEYAGIATALAAIVERRLYRRYRLRVVGAESRHGDNTQIRKKENCPIIKLQDILPCDNALSHSIACAEYFQDKNKRPEISRAFLVALKAQFPNTFASIINTTSAMNILSRLKKSMSRKPEERMEEAARALYVVKAKRWNCIARHDDTKTDSAFT